MQTSQAVADPVQADDIELLEMANLPREKTGIDGVIYISTAQANHAPRVRWYPSRPSAQAPCRSDTIEPSPQAFNHHLATRVFDAASAPVIAWVTLSAAARLDFWHLGVTWLDDEVTAFKLGLKTLPPRA